MTSRPTLADLLNASPGSVVGTASRDRITVTLPLPDRRLHAHAKGGWRGKAGATKQARAEAHFAALVAAKEIGGPPGWERARLTLRFFLPDRRRRDALNLAHSAKPLIDGCVDAGIVADDCWTVLEIAGVEAAVDKADPRCELIIERTA